MKQFKFILTSVMAIGFLCVYAQGKGKSGGLSETPVKGNQQVQPKTIGKNPADLPGDTLDVKSLVPKGQQLVTGNDTSSVNWTEQYVEAKGWAVMDKATYTIEGQAELMARSGAIAVAQRNLLEIINGVRIVGETTVKDMITTNDYIYKKLDGIIKGAEIVGQPLVSGNTVEVTMRVPLYEKKGKSESLAETFLDPAKNALKKSVDITGNEVIVGNNMTGTNQTTTNPSTLNPSVFPVIVDSTGNIVFDYSKYYNPASGKFPQYIKLTKDISDLFNLNKQSSQIISGAEQLASGQIKVKTDQSSKIANWSNVLNKVIQIGKFALLLL